MPNKDRHWKQIWEDDVASAVFARCDSAPAKTWNASVSGFQLGVIHDFDLNEHDIAIGNCRWCGVSASAGHGHIQK